MPPPSLSSSIAHRRGLERTRGLMVDLHGVAHGCAVVFLRRLPRAHRTVALLSRVGTHTPPLMRSAPPLTLLSAAQALRHRPPSPGTACFSSSFPLDACERFWSLSIFGSQLKPKPDIGHRMVGRVWISYSAYLTLTSVIWVMLEIALATF
jgi:hypothetical protein